MNWKRFSLSERARVNFEIAMEAVISNRLRSLLTALGIIFGVAAVIAMLAIGNGAQEEIMNQIKLVGLNNIVIDPVYERTEEKVGEEKEEKTKLSTGLTLADKESIESIIPGVVHASPEIMIDTYALQNGLRRSVRLVGVNPSYFSIFNFELEYGQMFSQVQMAAGAPVCVIGKSVKAKFFPTEDPIGKHLKCGDQWLEIIGVLRPRVISEKSISNLGIRDYNMDVYTPTQTVLVRYKDRNRITKFMIERAQNEDDENENATPQSNNYHQLDRLVVQVEETENLSATAEIISRMLKRRHQEVVDFEIEIPELLLKQQQRTNDIFNYVLGAIAGISLLVGGIGIMNIMLASVLERIKEIGLRLALGAKKTDIVNQFMFEAILISLSGGIIGVFLGISIAFAVSQFADIPTLISFNSVLVSFGVAAGVGLIFGITPARKAAMQDPITSLRYE